ncbi:PAS domain-containing sensor histidine kinase [Gemmatimonas sp.]
MSDEASPQFQQLAETVPNLLWTCRGDGPCTYLSAQWVAYTGRPAAEQLGYGWLDAIHPDDRDRTFATWSAAVESRSSLDVEFRIRRHDGEYRWFTTRAVPELDHNGNILMWYGSNTDIQERRDAEGELEVLQASLGRQVEERTAMLVRTRQQLEMAQRITHTGSWFFDVKANHVSWSDELFRIFRLPVSDICPQYNEQPALFHPASWRVLDAAVTRAAGEGIPYNLELRLADSSEGPRYAMASCEVERAADGSVARLYGTFQDVTDRVRARLDRDTALERLALATAFSGIGVWEWRVGDELLAWNSEMYRLFDIPTERTPDYEFFRSLVYGDDLPKIDQALQQTLKGQGDFHVTYRVPQRNGGMRYIRATAQIAADGNSNEARMIGICEDVTVETLAEKTRESNLTLLRQFIRYAPAAIAMFDTDLRYVEASERWPEMYHLGPASLVGRHHYEVFPEVPERWKQIHREVLAGTVHRHSEDPFVRADGTTQYIAWEAHPWRDDDGSVRGMLFFTQDVTDSINLRHQLEEQSAALRRSNEDLEQFAYASSHDLQEPLRAISGFAQILGRRYSGKLDPEADVIIGHMSDGVNRMRSLIDDLLAFSRVGSKLEVGAPARLSAAVEEALHNLSSSVQDTGATVNVGALPTVSADHRLMVQLFQNLIGNSIKYAGATSPRIEITSRSHDTEVEITVRDHGIGIPEVMAERVFQIFQRLHTREEYPGTGIGLALCRRIVDRHGGRIWLTQPEGTGCCIHFTVPLRARRS